MDESIRQPVRDRDQLEGILTTILDRLAVTAAAAVNYRVVGTAAAVLQGVPIQAGDLDILVGRRMDVEVLAKALSPFPCRTPVGWLPEDRQYFARYVVDGADVEISTVEHDTRSDLIECIGSGPWEHYISVVCGDRRVPAVRLELRLATELVRGRQDRASTLIEHLKEHGADTGLLQRVLIDRGVPIDVRNRIIEDVGANA